VKFLTLTAFRGPILNCYLRCPHYINYLESRRSERVGGDGGPCDYAEPRKGVVVPSSLPLFKSLARIWTTFARGANSREVAKWAERAVFVAGFPKGIKTVRLYEHPASNKWIVEFVRTVRFSIPSELYDEEKAKMASALLKMAELTNVGIRRTAGFGMIKYMPMISM